MVLPFGVFLGKQFDAPLLVSGRAFQVAHPEAVLQAAAAGVDPVTDPFRRADDEAITGPFGVKTPDGTKNNGQDQGHSGDVHGAVLGPTHRVRAA